MKKRLLIALGAFALVIVAAAWYYWRPPPVPPIHIITRPYTVEPIRHYARSGQDPGLFARYGEQVKIRDRVYIMGVYRGWREEEVTHRLDAEEAEELVALLAEAIVRPAGRSQSQPSGTAWSIYLVQNGDMYITLGANDVFVVPDTDGGRYRIINGDAIEAALERMVAE
jgi:hypothetical protein